MSHPIEEILQFEQWLEYGFKSILSGLVTAPVYDTTTRAETAVSPRIVVKAIVGTYKEHRHQFAQGVYLNGQFINADIFDSYESTIEVTVVTNRQDNTKTGDHRRLLGMTRAKMARWSVFQNWKGEIIYPQDVRPTGTTDSFIDDEDLDITVMTHEVVFVVNTRGIWPETIS